MARPLTRAEIIDKMHIVPVFSVINAETKQMCPVAQEDGSFCGCWFVDLADAEEHLAKLKAGHAEMQCTIEVTPLSKAFALSEQWVGTAALSGTGGVPLKLQASKAELARLPGFPPLPESLRRAFNPRTSRMPVWQMDELKGMPLFFHFDDLEAYWMAESGKPKEEMPQDGLDVRALREVIARATFEPFDWMGKLCLVAPRRSVQISTERMATEGAASEHDEPPPLEGG